MSLPLQNMLIAQSVTGGLRRNPLPRSDRCSVSRCVPVRYVELEDGHNRVFIGYRPSTGRRRPPTEVVAHNVLIDSIMIAACLFLVGCLGGFSASVLAVWLIGLEAVCDSPCEACARPSGNLSTILKSVLSRRCSKCGGSRRWPWFATFATGAFFAFYGWMLIDVHCQSVTEVRPESSLWQTRLPFQLIFLWLLLIVTLTDLLDYIIADFVVLAGVVFAITAAAVSGELQIIHVWVDWNSEWVQLNGPYLPEWMKQHQHLHGFVWPIAGIVAGAGLMWLLRCIGSAILGHPAVGLGDVTLMALIGAFLGWQPTLCTLAIAPIAGLVIGISIRVLTGRSFVAFGPYLTSAAVVVLLSWRWLWVDLNLRTLFGHWPTVAAMIVAAGAAVSLALGMLRIYRALPSEVMKR